AVIRLENVRQALTGGLVGGAEVGLLGRSVDPLLSQVEVLRSRAIAGAVVDSLPLLRIVTRRFPDWLLEDVRLTATARSDTLELSFERDSVAVRGRAGERRVAYGAAVEMDGFRFAVAEPPRVERGTLFVRGREAAVSALLARLRVTPRQNTDVIDIAYTARDPQRAQEVVNRVVGIFQLTNARAAQQQARRQREFIEAQLQRSDSALAVARLALSAFRSRQGSERNGVAGSQESRGDGGLVVRRQELDGERRMLRGLVARLQESSAGKRREALRTAVSLPGIAVNLEVARLFTQLVQYETTHDSLTSGRWAIARTHPDVQRMNELLTFTEARLVPAVQSAVQSRIASLDASIATLDDLRARNASRYQRLSATEAEQARLVEQVENASKIADQLRTEQQKARIAEAVEVGQVEIVDPAPLPTVPIGIGLMRKLAFGLLLGLLLGGTGAFVADHLDRSITRQKDVAGLGLPVLGVVPHIGATRNGVRKHTATPVIEALRGIRLNLVHAYGSAGPLLVTVTSPESRDGKSFIGSNLALAFADANHRTLLIDGDLRRGALHRLLKVARRPGLADFLQGEATREQILHSTSYQSLYFVGCGARTSDAPELLSSAAMSQLVTSWRSQYSVIIIDSPPLGAGVDAFALGTMTGNLVMVLRLGATDREVAEAKLELLARLPVRVLGVVLNDVPQGPLYKPYAYYIEGYEAENEKGRGVRILGAD
ncbi:MAG: polysaccharide biosynthesis tyrosine autokinase, partial [Gemmatimonadales bacterium]